MKNCNRPLATYITDGQEVHRKMLDAITHERSANKIQRHHTNSNCWWAARQCESWYIAGMHVNGAATVENSLAVPQKAKYGILLGPNSSAQGIPGSPYMRDSETNVC